jgi:4-nitrophenyl phosphatase
MAPPHEEVRLNPSQIAGIRAIILDMDGVLWRGSENIGDLPALFQEITMRRWKFILATNNATRSIAQYVEIFNGLGITIESRHVINSGQAAAHYLKKCYPQGGPLYIIGEEGLISTMVDAGFYQSEEHPLGVLAGLNRQLTYDMLRKACLLIRSGVPFYGTNPDATYPSPEGLIPGAGTVIGAIEIASDVKAHLMGKPSPEMYQLALERLATSPGETLVVGDRLDTDIAGGQVLGCLTGLVLSGVSTLEEVSHWTPPPDLIADDLTSLLEITRIASSDR